MAEQVTREQYEYAMSLRDQALNLGLSGTVEELNGIIREMGEVLDQESEYRTAGYVAEQAEIEADEHAVIGDELRSTITDEIADARDAGDLEEADIPEANSFATEQSGVALEGSFEITMRGVHAKAFLEQNFSELSPAWLSGIDNEVLKNSVITIKNMEDQFTIELKEVRGNFFKDVKDGISDFAHKFSKGKDEAKQNLVNRISEGLKEFSDKAKELEDKMLDGAVKAFEEVGKTLDKAEKAVKEGVKDIQNSVILKRVIEAAQDARADRLQEKADKKAFLDKYMENEGIEKLNPIKADLLWRKEKFNRFIQAEKDEFNKKIEAFKETRIGCFGRQTADNVKSGINKVLDTKKNVERFIGTFPARASAAAEKNFHKLVDGGVKKWKEMTEFGKGVKANVSMAIAAVKMKEALRREIAEINKEFNKDVKKIKKEVAKELKQDAKEYDKLLDERIIEADDKIKSLKKEIKGLEKVVKNLEEIGDKEGAEKYKAQIEAKEAEIEELDIDAEFDSIKKQMNKDDLKEDLKDIKSDPEVIGRIEQREAVRKEQIDAAIEKLNQKKEFAKNNVQAKREDTKAVVVAGDKNTKNYIDTVEKSKMVEAITAAKRLQAKILSAGGQKKESLEKISEAEQEKQNWAHITAGAKNGTVHLDETFTKENATELVKASADLRKTTEEIRLDFVEMGGDNRTEVAKQMQVIDNKIEALKELAKERDMLEKTKEVMASKGETFDNKDALKLERLSDAYDRTSNSLKDLAKTPEIESAAFIERCNDQTTGVYNVDISKGESGKLIITEQEDIRKELMDFARGMGYSEEALDKVAQMANSLADQPKEYQVEITAVTNVMKADAEPVLCVSRTDANLNQVNFITDKEGNVVSGVERKLDEPNPAFGSQTIFGHDRDGNAHADISLIQNGPTKAAIADSGLKSAVESFEHEADAQKEKGAEKSDPNKSVEDAFAESFGN